MTRKPARTECTTHVGNARDTVDLHALTQREMHLLRIDRAIRSSLQAFYAREGDWRPVTRDVVLHGASVLLLRASARMPFPLKYVCDMAGGMRLCCERAEHTTLSEAFQLAFPSCEWSEDRVESALQVWRSSPAPVLAAFREAGRTGDGLWADLEQQLVVRPRTG